MSFRARRRSSLAATVMAVLAGAVFASGAFAADEVTNAVIRDYAGDADITACAFTQAQLEFVRSQITQDIDDYAPDLRIEVVSEIARWTSGGCSGLPGGMPGGPPGATTGGETGGQTGGQPGSQLFTFRATISSLKLAKNRRSVKVKLRCPTTAAPACGILLTGKLAGRSAAKKKVAAITAGTTKTVTLKLTKATVKRLTTKGGKLKISAKTVGSALASATRTIKLAPKSS